MLSAPGGILRIRPAGTAARVEEPGWALRAGAGQGACCAPKGDPKLAIDVPQPAPPAVEPARQPPARRRSIWELGASLHCSIIGTCLSADDLRRVLRKLGQDSAEATDYALHGIAVGLCGSQSVGSKLINRALDEKHRATIRRLDAVRNADALRQAWRDAVASGEIPGAYWAALTHPCAERPLVVDLFGEVHMLSHLVGAANRADIRRLAAQEREIAALRETVARQQARLRTDIGERDDRIRALQDLLASRPAGAAGGTVPELSEYHRVATDLARRAEREARRREAAERRADAAEAQVREAQDALRRAERAEAALLRELAAAEAALAPAQAAAATTGEGIVLYVGGRSGQTALLRQAAERLGLALLHHDAEQGSALLPGLISRADLVVFPVDCVSHDAALGVKRLCRQHDKPFRALRSTGAASLLAELAQSRPA